MDTQKKIIILNNSKLSPDYLRDLLIYEPETGELIWKDRDLSFFNSVSKTLDWNERKAYTKAFTQKSGAGYLTERVDGHTLLAHRVAWTVHTGAWPSKHIDHINGDKSDNRIENLRLATPSENCCNKRTPANNTSGFKGVAWVKSDKRWRATIGVSGKIYHLGQFKNIKDAVAAYAEGSLLLHGEFGRTA